MSSSNTRRKSGLRSVAAKLPIAGLCIMMSSWLLAQSSDQTPQHATVLTAPQPYQATYTARAMGMSTEAFRRLEQDSDNGFTLSHGLSVSVLGANLITVEESSEFNWADTGAVPLTYHYRQTGVRKRDEHVSFAWHASDPEQSVATLNRDDREAQQQDISQGTLDNLSFSAQLSAELMHNPALREAETMLSYQILDARRVETHEYRVLGEERISTPAGELDTIKLERIRDIDSERTTVIWLSASHQYILARLSQTEGGGSAMELSLVQVTWTGDDENPATAGAE